MQRVGVLAAPVVLLCCGGVTAIGALAGDPEPVRQVAPAAGNQVAEEPAAEAAPASAATEAPGEPEATPATVAPTTAAAPEGATPAVDKRTVVERQTIRNATRRVKTASLDKGETRVRTKGAAGVRTLTYEVTYTDGEPTARKLMKSEVTRKPVTRVIEVGTRESGGGDCTPGYSPCVPVASDVDCAGGSGDGPKYVRGPIRVTGSDPYDLDRDGDGIACD